MKIIFDYTFPELFSINNLLIKRSLKKRAALLIIMYLFIAGSLIPTPFNLNAFIRYLIFTSLMVAVVIYLFPLIVFSIRSIFNSKSSGIPIFNIDEGGLTIKNQVGGLKKSIPWKQITDIVYDKDMILVFIDRKLIAIPNRHLEFESQRIELIEKIKKRIYNYIIDRPDWLKSKPPYWMGLLCLIPLVGAIIGVVLIVNGIFKYNKNVKLIAMGIGGLIFTSTVYYSLFKYYESNTGRSQFISFTQSDLNTLMGLVEFYKIKHGEYPDSLGQLKTNNQFLSTVDPTQVSEVGQNATEYYYHKIGNKYQLFSFGLDGKPNTADDIYPDASPADTGKIGLILKK